MKRVHTQGTTITRFIGDAELLELDAIIKSAASETLTALSVARFGLYQAVLTHHDGSHSLVSVEDGEGELEHISDERAQELRTEQPYERGRC